MKPTIDLYALLEIESDASPEEIRKAFKQHAFLNHPDRGGSSQYFTEVTHAYQVLSNPQKRAEYDRARDRKYQPFEYTPEEQLN